MVKDSAPAGLVFAGLLLLIVVSFRTNYKLDKKALLTGLTGALVLIVPIAIAGGSLGKHTPAGNFWVWSLVVSLVAIAEEAFLRGVLYDALQHWLSRNWAIAGGAAVFGLMHVPLYGWSVLPLDIIVGVWLGGLRSYSRSFMAPAIAHSLADMAGWWLR